MKKRRKKKETPVAVYSPKVQLSPKRRRFIQSYLLAPHFHRRSISGFEAYIFDTIETFDPLLDIHYLTLNNQEMATQEEPDGRLKICPYNTRHRVALTKYASHIVACAKAFKNSDLAQCAFHACHRIPKNEYLEHLYNCEYMNEEILEKVILPKMMMTETTATDLASNGPSIEDDGDWS